MQRPTEARIPANASSAAGIHDGAQSSAAAPSPDRLLPQGAVLPAALHHMWARLGLAGGAAGVHDGAQVGRCGADTRARVRAPGLD